MSKTRKDTGNGLQTKSSELTEAETNAIADLKERKRSRVRAPEIKLDFEEETRRLTVGHKGKNPNAACALAMHELGTVDYRFFEGVMDQVAVLGQQDSSVSETASNFVMSVVAGVRPKGEIEAMLAIQMGAIHQATMMMARRLNHVKRLNDAPRCTATAKSTGQRCRAPSVRGWTVCRVHGARGGHAAGPSHPSWKHGERSRNAEQFRKTISELIRADKELRKLIHGLVTDWSPTQTVIRPN